MRPPHVAFCPAVSPCKRMLFTRPLCNGPNDKETKRTTTATRYFPLTLHRHSLVLPTLTLTLTSLWHFLLPSPPLPCSSPTPKPNQSPLPFYPSIYPSFHPIPSYPYPSHHSPVPSPPLSRSTLNGPSCPRCRSRLGDWGVGVCGVCERVSQ